MHLDAQHHKKFHGELRFIVVIANDVDGMSCAIHNLDVGAVRELGARHHQPPLGIGIVAMNRTSPGTLVLIDMPNAKLANTSVTGPVHPT
jgi:hypothetical protein